MEKKKKQKELVRRYNQNKENGVIWTHNPILSTKQMPYNAQGTRVHGSTTYL